MKVFLAAATQWRYAGMSGLPIGLDYSGIEAMARISAIDLTPALFHKLQIMEQAALQILHERRPR